MYSIKTLSNLLSIRQERKWKAAVTTREYFSEILLRLKMLSHNTSQTYYLVRLGYRVFWISFHAVHFVLHFFIMAINFVCENCSTPSDPNYRVNSRSENPQIGCPYKWGSSGRPLGAGGNGRGRGGWWPDKTSRTGRGKVEKVNINLKTGER